MRNRGVVSQKRGDGCAESVWELGYDFRIISEQELGSAEIIDAAAARKRGSQSGGLCFPTTMEQTPKRFIALCCYRVAYRFKKKLSNV